MAGNAADLGRVLTTAQMLAVVANLRTPVVRVLETTDFHGNVFPSKDRRSGRSIGGTLALAGTLTGRRAAVKRLVGSLEIEMRRARPTQGGSGTGTHGSSVEGGSGPGGESGHVVCGPAEGSQPTIARAIVCDLSVRHDCNTASVVFRGPVNWPLLKYSCASVGAAVAPRATVP